MEKTTIGTNEGVLSNTLQARKSVYGDYRDVIETRTKIMASVKNHYYLVNGVPMTQDLEVAFGDLVMKLVRAVAAPTHGDSFHDLSGYAALLEKIYVKDN